MEEDRKRAGRKEVRERGRKGGREGGKEVRRKKGGQTLRIQTKHIYFDRILQRESQIKDVGNIQSLWSTCLKLTSMSQFQKQSLQYHPHQLIFIDWLQRYLTHKEVRLTSFLYPSLWKMKLVQPSKYLPEEKKWTCSNNLNKHYFQN